MVRGRGSQFEKFSIPSPTVATLLLTFEKGFLGSHTSNGAARPTTVARRTRVSPTARLSRPAPFRPAPFDPSRAGPGRGWGPRAMAKVSGPVARARRTADASIHPGPTPVHWPSPPGPPGAGSTRRCLPTGASRESDGIGRPLRPRSLGPSGRRAVQSETPASTPARRQEGPRPAPRVEPR